MRSVAFLALLFLAGEAAAGDSFILRDESGRRVGTIERDWNSDAWVRRESVLNDLVQTASDDEMENPSVSVDDEIQSVEKFVDSLIPAYLLSLSEENAPDVADSRELPNFSVEFSETIKIVRETVRELPEKEREIIESLYFRHLSTTELAKKMGVNKSWVSRLHSKAVNRLRHAAIKAERGELIRLWRANEIGDEVMHHLMEMLDYEQARLPVVESAKPAAAGSEVPQPAD
jgi:RNA polymerase sigma factor (sigma-70 family)